MHFPERRHREQEVARALVREERGRDGEPADARVRVLAAEVERRPHEDVPEAVDRGIGLPVRAEEIGEGALGRVKPGRPCEQPEDPQPVAERDVGVAEKCP